MRNGEFERTEKTTRASNALPRLLAAGRAWSESCGGEVSEGSPHGRHSLCNIPELSAHVAVRPISARTVPVSLMSAAPARVGRWSRGLLTCRARLERPPESCTVRQSCRKRCPETQGGPRDPRFSSPRVVGALQAALVRAWTYFVLDEVGSCGRLRGSNWTFAPVARWRRGVGTDDREKGERRGRKAASRADWVGARFESGAVRREEAPRGSKARRAEERARAATGRGSQGGARARAPSPHLFPRLALLARLTLYRVLCSGNPAMSFGRATWTTTAPADVTHARGGPATPRDRRRPLRRVARASRTRPRFRPVDRPSGGAPARRDHHGRLASWRATVTSRSPASRPALRHSRRARDSSPCVQGPVNSGFASSSRPSREKRESSSRFRTAPRTASGGGYRESR